MIQLRHLAVSFFCLLHITCSHAQTLQRFDLKDVRISDGPFYEAQQTDLHYMLQLDPDRLLSPFLLDAGLPVKAESYGNWENTGLDGHIGGHYISALANMYAATGNEEALKRLNYMIDNLAACQNKNGNGYVGGIPGGQAMWKEIAAGNIRADYFSLNGKWVPLYNIHKLFAGLRDAYLVADHKKAGDVLIKLTDWFVGLATPLTDEQLQLMLKSEHGGMNEILADVAAITKDEKYLTLARRFSHQLILSPLLEKRDALTGLHANTQIPKVIGYKRIADISHDSTWSNAADFFWETVVQHRSVSIGGNSVREHFHPADDFSSMVESNQGPETCNTYNMLRLSTMLFLSDPDVRYVDYYERALYNHILSSQHPQGGFVYFTPMRPRHYRVYSQPQESFWCCVGSGLENHSKYGEFIYAHDNNSLYVNLFMASKLDWKEKGITVTQTTKFPFEEKSNLKLTLDKAKKLSLFIRYPKWVKPGVLKIDVNNKSQKFAASPGSFVEISRTWKNGDVISVTLPMHTEVEFLPDSSSWGSLVHGPIVLAAATDTTDLIGLKANDSRMGHVADGSFYAIEKAPVLVNHHGDLAKAVTKVPGEPMTFSVASAVYPDQYSDLKLVPFFTLHDARYMLYWQVTDPKNLQAMIESMREKEKESLQLAARTVDEVASGEQQPESEHNVKGEETESGSTDEGQRWRMARGWFSYDLKNQTGKAKVLRVTYANWGRNRKFDILLNEELLQTVTLDEAREGKSFFIDYTLPEQVRGKEIVNVKFKAHKDHSTGRIYGVRLLK